MSQTEPPISCITLCFALLLLLLGLIAFFSDLLILAIISWASIPVIIIVFYIMKKKGWKIT